MTARLTALRLPDRNAPDEVWRQRAVCQNLSAELFYPHGNSAWEVDPPKAVCRSCPVREDCLEYALAHREAFGIWGGATERERRSLVRSRRLEGKRAC